MMNKALKYVSELGNTGVHIVRWVIVLTLLWIGGANALLYEPYGYVPVLSYDPEAGFFSHIEAINASGQKPDNFSWHPGHKVDTASFALASLLIVIGVMIALYHLLPAVSAAGSFLAFILSLGTLFVLIITPEKWTTNFGDINHGFPNLSTAGTLAVANSIMLGASLVTMIQAAKSHLEKKRKLSVPT